jgi:ABC-type multidrug transport system fused ATPase/permease subunit
MQMTGQRIMQDMRRQIFAHLQRLHVAYFDKNPVGRLMTRVTTDVDAVNELFTSGVVTVFGDIFTLFGIMGVMLALDARLALVTFSVIPLFFLVTNWFRKGARQSFRETRKWVARINAFLQENLTGMSVVQLFRREERNRAAFAEINRKHADANMTAIFYYAVFYPAIELLAALAVGLILVWGGSEVLQGTVTLGVLVAFIQYSERFWRPISDLSEKFNILQAAMASSERIFLLLDTEPRVKSPAAPHPLGVVRGRVAFEHVWFSYADPAQYILRDIDFVVEPGRSVALVGATGAGKTSIISLLTRFYDVQQGRVTLDGVDVRELGTDELRRSLALVLQDVHLFSGTIASNVRLGSTVSDERVREAARAVHAHRFIEALPRGHETEVKERGATRAKIRLPGDRSC